MQSNKSFSCINTQLFSIDSKCEDVQGPWYGKLAEAKQIGICQCLAGTRVPWWKKRGKERTTTTATKTNLTVLISLVVLVPFLCEPRNAWITTFLIELCAGYLQVKLITIRSRTFSVVAPSLWNAQPHHQSFQNACKDFLISSGIWKLWH